MFFIRLAGGWTMRLFFDSLFSPKPSVGSGVTGQNSSQHAYWLFGPIDIAQEFYTLSINPD